jgi:hypothetical protein
MNPPLWGKSTPRLCAILEQPHRRLVMEDASEKEILCCSTERLSNPLGQTFRLEIQNSIFTTMAFSQMSASHLYCVVGGLFKNLSFLVDSLHFGAQEVVFECRQSYASEKYPQGAPREMGLLTDLFRKTEEPHPLGFYHPNDSVDAESFYDFWARVVEYYSRCKLTIASDKLIVISGIAKIIQHALGDTYFAGLWKRKFPRCLLWEVPVSEHENDILPLAVCTAPSWSWANVRNSVDVPKTPNSPQVRTIAEVVTTKVTTTTSDVTGEVVSGFIRLRGVLKTVVFKQISERPISVNSTIPIM